MMLNLARWSRWWPWPRTDSAPVAQAPASPQVKTAASVSGGWVSVSVARLSALEGIQASLKALRASEREWKHECTEAWFRTLRRRSRVSLIGMALELHDQPAASLDEALEVKRSVTASGILFGFSVPGGLWQMDRFVIQKVLRYLVLCEQVDYDPMLGRVDASLDVPHFSSLVQRVGAFPVVVAALCSTQRAMNFVSLQDHVWADKELKALCQSEPMVLKKALSAAYLVAGVSVPRDYLYVDPEVKDYVRREGAHAPSKRPILSVVKNELVA